MSTSSPNYIRCRFCDWTSRKFGAGSNPTRAFGRLAHHIEVTHPDEDDKLSELR